MQRFRIQGGATLQGQIAASGAKNAALPILIASILTERECVFSNVPRLEDIETLIKILSGMGVQAQWSADHRLSLSAGAMTTQEAPYDWVRRMRASVLVLGPLVARFGSARVSLPGGCAIGARPIQFHLEALEKLGATISLEAGYVIAKAKRLRGARIQFPFPSVGATENTLMAAVLAQGISVIENAAREPEIVDLAGCLIGMGAKISGQGTSTITVQGVDRLSGVHHSIMSDRIEAGTLLLSGPMTGGKVRVVGMDPTHLDCVIQKLKEAGADVKTGPDWVEASADRGQLRGVSVITEPHPGFPTDMQAQWMALMCQAQGESSVQETIFESRFMHVPELIRMGAKIEILGNLAKVRGIVKLTGAPVMATDLRASAGLVLAGLVASGETHVRRIYHLDRGYENLEKKLTLLGAKVWREEEE